MTSKDCRQRTAREFERGTKSKLEHLCLNHFHKDLTLYEEEIQSGYIYYNILEEDQIFFKITKGAKKKPSYTMVMNSSSSEPDATTLVISFRCYTHLWDNIE